MQKNGRKPLKTRRFKDKPLPKKNIKKNCLFVLHIGTPGLNFGVTSSNHTFKLSQIPDEILLAPLLVFWANKFMKPLHCLAPDFRIYCQYPVDAPHEWYIYLHLPPKLSKCRYINRQYNECLGMRVVFGYPNHWQYDSRAVGLSIYQLHGS